MTSVSSLVWFVALSRTALDSVIGNAGRNFRSPTQYKNPDVTYVANKFLVSHMWPVVMTLPRDAPPLESTAGIARGRILAEKWSVSAVKEI
jgi:hypothetical protein